MSLAAAAAASVVLLTALAGTGQATFPGSDGPIVFQNPRGLAIYTINPNGSGENRIPGTGPNSGINFSPSFSADGTRIVFSHTNSQTDVSSIVSMNPDGSDRQAIIRRHGVHFYAPSFSPNGKRIVFLFKDDVWGVRASGGDAHKLGGTGGHDMAPSYSPDGSLILWGAGNRIYLMRSDGTHRRLLARGPNAGEPSFSPDGESVLFTGGPRMSDTTIRNVLEINVDGSGRHRVTNDATATFVYHSPHFSPQGTRIVATGTNPTPECAQCDQLQIMNANGGNRHPLTMRSSFNPDWGPAAG